VNQVGIGCKYLHILCVVCGITTRLIVIGHVFYCIGYVFYCIGYILLYVYCMGYCWYVLLYWDYVLLYVLLVYSVLYYCTVLL
jgi:hypothetical protein